MPSEFVQVILPLSLHETYTYRIPEEYKGKINTGQRVIVQFGRKKLFSALVLSVEDSAPLNIKVKEILQIVDEEPVVLQVNIDMWKWMAEYYCCSLGDVYRAAFPPGLILESKSKVFLTGHDKEYSLTDKEYLIIDHAGPGSVSLDKLQQKLGKQFSYKAFSSLLVKGLIGVDENIEPKFKTKKSSFIKLNPEIKNEEQLNEIIQKLSRSKKQLSLLLRFCEETLPFDEGEGAFILKKELLRISGISAVVLKSLIKEGALIEFHREVSRIESFAGVQLRNINTLSQYQFDALADIKEGFDKNKVVLLHGITASGKTEIYIHLIEETIKRGRQVLYLVPEIMLTTQIIERLRQVFGNKMGVYHSGFSNDERVEIWKKVLMFKSDTEKSFQIITGTRSSLFLPFSELGLVIVDEEHENSYKQFDPAPRYNARDMAIVLARQYRANVLLGSATPSYESYFNALNGKYHLVLLERRYSNIELPEVKVVDIKKARVKKQMLSVLSSELYHMMKFAFGNKDQVILFQNRRGYSPFVQCFECGWIPKCKNCDVSLTFHKFNRQLNCHYCGYSILLPPLCPSCGSEDIKTRGVGTEKIEEELKPLFPDIQIRRIDYDTTRRKDSYTKILSDMKRRKTDLLVGTRMITKGLDFEHIRVVGIVDADTLINFPDFRAHERAFQLISQVSGRAGRKHNRGTVIIQTSHPDHPLIGNIVNQDYISAFNMEMEERKLFKYPPYYRLIKISVKHQKAETVNRTAGQLASLLKERFPFIVLGPEYPLVGRVQSKFIKEIWLKIGLKQSLSRAKQIILLSVADVRKRKENSSCIINVDVDPA